MDKYRYKWNSLNYWVANQIQQSCNLECSKDCFTRYYSVMSAFVQCIRPVCGCNQPSSDELKGIFTTGFFEAEESEMQLAETEVVNKTVEVIAEAFAPKRKEEEPKKEERPYNLYQDCDLFCHKDCFSIRKIAPYPILEQCVADRCNCNH